MIFSPFFIITIVLGFSPVYSSLCSDNEIETDCVNPCNTCEQKGRCHQSPTPCRHGCDCKPGFFREENGVCVPEQQCLAKSSDLGCPKNALYLSCVPLHLPTCENPFPEPDYDDECVPGCACRPEFLKRKDGQCVTPQQCYASEDPGKESLCQEDEEYYECIPNCKNTCENIHNPGVKCRCGPPGCFCREGLVKGADGKCIQPEQCPQLPSSEDPAPKCPKNAIFIKCGSPCPPTCDDLQPEPCEEKCTTACYCKPGYLKRKDGVCVRPIDCHPRKKPERPTPKCPKNAIFIECGSPCPPTCENRLPEPCEEKCTKACYCKPGFLLKTDEGKCVKPENCNTTHVPVESQRKCASDEQFYECTPNCKNTCKNIYNSSAKCHCGPPGCFCKEGLVKREDGKCVNPDQCEECGPEEQFYECKPSCKNTCSHFQNPGVQCRCGPPGCFCKQGLVKRSDGKCVPPNQCPVSLHHDCAEDEKFYNCTPNCKNTCENFSNPAIRCGCGPPGCFCKDGLVKRTDGKCVPPNQCHECLHPGEEFQECGSICPDTCENRGRPSPGSCPNRCIRGCYCKKGLYRSKDGNCVPLKDCDTERYFTSPRPITTREKMGTIAVTVPDDCHGCPNAAQCEAYCKSLGDFAGFCIGRDHRHCRCA